MIRLRALEILEEKKKTKYWLYNQLYMSYGNFNKMVKNETQGIRYKTLEMLCEILECSPNDLFEIKPDN